MTIPPSLRSSGLDPLWDAVRRRLERAEVDHPTRGRITVPHLASTDRLALSSILGRPPGRTIGLDALEVALARLGLGPDLADALAVLGHPVSEEPARARSERRLGRNARAAARAGAAGWPEPWSGSWIDEVVRAGILRGLDVEHAVAFVRSVRRVLDHLDEAVDEGAVDEGAVDDEVVRCEARPRHSRLDVAAAVLGSSHALDTGTRLEAAATRALAHRLGPAPARDLWERAGAHLDLTSGPVLTWNLRLVPTHPLAPLLAASTAAGVPVHLTQFALRRHPLDRLVEGDVLLVENPRIAEAAAQLAFHRTVVATNGNPSGAVQLLVDQLLATGATLRYHGDFDTAGLALCARMARLGVQPWRMTAADYEDACDVAAASGVDLPLDDGSVPATPWDPHLQASFERRRQVIHEERLLPALFDLST